MHACRRLHTHEAHRHTTGRHADAQKPYADTHKCVNAHGVASLLECRRVCEDAQLANAPLTRDTDAQTRHCAHTLKTRASRTKHSGAATTYSAPSHWCRYATPCSCRTTRSCTRQECWQRWGIKVAVVAAVVAMEVVVLIGESAGVAGASKGGRAVTVCGDWEPRRNQAHHSSGVRCAVLVDSGGVPARVGSAP